MPRLHNQLRQRLDFECLNSFSHDSDDDAEDERNDTTQRAAKRRRIEAIAAQYMRGRPPLILSAGLRGPFNGAWKNPWATRPSKRAESKRAAGLDRKLPERATVQGAQDAETRDHCPDSRGLALSLVPSPETSRAVAVMDRQDPAEAPLRDLPPQGDDSEDTDVFSMSTTQPTATDRCETNLFWLRRQSGKQSRLKQSKSGNYNHSPTRTRIGRHPISNDGGLHLAPPKVPLVKARSSPVNPLVLRSEWRSSPSKSTAISSPDGPPNVVLPKVTTYSPSNENQPSATGPMPADIHQPAGYVMPLSEANVPASNASVDMKEQILVVRPTLSQSKKSKIHMVKPGPNKRNSTFTPIKTRSRNSGRRSELAYTNLLESANATAILLQDAPPCVAAGHYAATNLALLAVDTAQKIRPPSREDVIRSAERCISSNHSSKVRRSGGKVKSSRTRHESTPSSAATLLHHTSTECKSGNNLQPQRTSPMEVEGRRGRRDIYEVPSSDERKSTSHSHQHSGLSTQTAMMLARLEFQEGSMPSGTVGTPGPWTAGQDDNAHQDGEEPSLELVPFSAFNAKLEGRHTQDKVSDELPISTQELFSAASPFAFSTIKKPVKSQGSGLRFAVFPSGTNESVEQHSGAKSPTPSQRMPLKERNAKMVIRNAAQEKGSQGSQSREPTLAEHDIELPQLDFGALRDDVGPHGDLDFTDRFLRNLDNMT